MNPKSTLQGGFSMIEVLISILILSMGVLGVLGLVIKSMQFSSSANYRSVAAQQAYSIAEMLRANPSMLNAFRGLPATSPAMNNNCLLAAGCSSGDWNTTAYSHWKRQLAATLPNGDGYICQDSTNDGLAENATAPSAADWMCDGTGPFVIKVCWNESRAAIGAFAGGALCVWTTL